ncbi:MAG TPA: PilZ domain-containing protein [Bryobacteraceae bacterium]|nr:PilZ domain-containing protein [Bryobacteraceae bacterium]
MSEQDKLQGYDPDYQPADELNRRVSTRHLCSDLISVRWSSGRGFSREAIAVMEDFSVTGAGLFMENKIGVGEAVRLRNEQVSLAAWVRRCEWRDNGYLIAVEFDEPLPDNCFFVPKHVLF